MREKTPAEKIFEQGIERGIEKGIEKGIERGFLETVRSLISSGLFNDEQIATALHKPLENIKAIRKELEAATV